MIRTDLYALSGASREAFSKFPHPRATAMFAPTFAGEGVVRLADVTRDPRYGKNHPYHGMPPGHLPVRSYLAVPVKGLSGNVLGGLFFGHSQPDMFDEQDQRLAVGVASWASVALENARLYSEAHDANRLKDEFLAVLSHELRTPLNAIVGYSRLMRGQMLAPDQIARAIETLERNARWLTQIVEDVLDVSRIVSGKIRLDVQAVEIAGVVDNAVATVQPAADAKGVRLQSLIDPRIGPVAGDPDRLQQVVWNLLSNAVKFTPKGGRVHVRLERVNSHVEIIVSDSGIGISKDFLPLVFDRFRQADSGSTRKTGGLGLGLSIVRHLVEMHGGSVHAASAGPEQGSTFTVRLPVMAVQPSAPIKREHPLAQLDTPLQQLANLGGVRVLAVDDDADALGPVERRAAGSGRRRGHGIIGRNRPGNDPGVSSSGAGRRHRHARSRRLRADQADSSVGGPAGQRGAGGGADRIRAVRGSHQGAAERFRDALVQACRSRRARGVGRYARSPLPRSRIAAS